MQLNDPTLQVSHETIYTALYAMPRGELRTELIACLRQARKSRRVRALRPPLARSLSEPCSSSHWQKWFMQLPQRQLLNL